MVEQNKSEQATTNQSSGTDSVPNEQAGFYFSSFLKITDPESGKVLVQTRAD
jgi:hypothetical protein